VTGRSTFRTVGLDLSLTSTGTAWLIQGPHDPAFIETQTFTSAGSATATLDDRWRRLQNLSEQIWNVARCADLVVIEGPSYASKNPGSAHDRSGLWWRVVDRLVAAEIPVVEVPPSCRAKYATGKGNAAKTAVLLAAERRYPQAGIEGDDTADAVVLAAMGARHLGRPAEASLPATHLAGMTGVRWPDVPALI
jgi:Holliday junction resolvasome RuvABC endonuclease subunit